MDAIAGDNCEGWSGQKSELFHVGKLLGAAGIGGDKFNFTLL